MLFELLCFVCFLGLLFVLIAAAVSTPVAEIRDDDFPEGPFRHSSDIDGDT